MFGLFNQTFELVLSCLIKECLFTIEGINIQQSQLKELKENQ